MDDQYEASSQSLETGDQQPPDSLPLIMFVDDNKALLHGMGQLLEFEGFDVLLAEDGVDALTQLEAPGAEIPLLIISDIAMPNMDGFELFQRIRKHRGKDWILIQFLFLTAFDQAETLRQAWELDPDAFLVKPFDEQYLVQLVHSRLRRRKQLLEILEAQQEQVREQLLMHIEDQQAALREEMMAEIEEEREQLRESQDSLAMMVSHELRTPLVSMNIVADLLSSDIDQMDVEQVHYLLDMMQGGSIRLTRLVEQMVMYVQVRSGAMAEALHSYFRPRPVADALASAIRTARQADYRKRGIPIEQATDPLDAYVNCDLNSLQHAIAEVILNAIGFSKPGGTIVIRQTIADGEVRITVCDEGLGIDANELGNVFEPFYQVDRRKKEQQGIGIGLTLAKEIVEAHNGSLSLESQVGHGTDVTITLPTQSGDE